MLAKMQDVQGFACSENCESSFRYSKCVPLGGVEAPVLWERCGQICVVESRGELEGSKMEAPLLWEEKQRWA